MFEVVAECIKPCLHSFSQRKALIYEQDSRLLTYITYMFCSFFNLYFLLLKKHIYT